METPSKVPPTERTTMRNTVLVVIASAVIGGLVGGSVFFFMSSGLTGRPQEPLASPPPSEAEAKIPTAPADGDPTPASPGSEWSSPLASATQMVAAGRLREAQEEYLSILLVDPTHEEAMKGLVRVVGLLAKGDRAALRRQAEAYRRAVELGLETEEHYTAPAMELLARASLQAAGVRATAVEPRPQPQPSPPPAPPTAARQPAPTRPERTTQKASPAPQPRPAPSRPAPSRPAPPAPPTQPAPPPPPAAAPLNVNEPFVTVVIGPFGTSERASSVTGELTVAGYTARLRRQAEGSYIVTLGPYRRSEAARAAEYVKSRFGRSVPVAMTPVP